MSFLLRKKILNLWVSKVIVLDPSLFCLAWRDCLRLWGNPGQLPRPKTYIYSLSIQYAGMDRPSRTKSHPAGPFSSSQPARPNSWTKYGQKSSEFSSLLFTVTSTTLHWDFYFLKLIQLPTVSYSSATIHCKAERRKSRYNPIPPSLWFKKSIQKPQTWELSRLCPEISTKLYCTYKNSASELVSSVYSTKQINSDSTKNQPCTSQNEKLTRPVL